MPTLFINTDAPSKRSALVRSASQYQTLASFPEMIVGNQLPLTIILLDSEGVTDSRSGNPDYGLELAVGLISAQPDAGDWSITIGDDTATVAYNVLPAALDTALNALDSVIAGGGLNVVGERGVFKIKWNTVGVKPAISVDGSNLSPASGISIVDGEDGDSTTRESKLIRINRIAGAYMSPSDFTPVAADSTGPARWEGILNLSTLQAALLVGNRGAVNVDIELALIDPDARISTLLKSNQSLQKNLVDPTTLGSITLPTLESINAQVELAKDWATSSLPVEGELESAKTYAGLARDNVSATVNTVITYLPDAVNGDSGLITIDPDFSSNAQYRTGTPTAVDKITILYDFNFNVQKPREVTAYIISDEEFDEVEFVYLDHDASNVYWLTPPLTKIKADTPYILSTRIVPSLDAVGEYDYWLAAIEID